jgi:hypothetical protein
LAPGWRRGSSGMNGAMCGACGTLGAASPSSDTQSVWQFSLCLMATPVFAPHLRWVRAPNEMEPSAHTEGPCAHRRCHRPRCNPGPPARASPARSPSALSGVTSNWRSCLRSDPIGWSGPHWPDCTSQSAYQAVPSGTVPATPTAQPYTIIGTIVLSRFAGVPNCAQALLPLLRRQIVSSSASPNTSEPRLGACGWNPTTLIARNWSLGAPKGCHPLHWPVLASRAGTRCGASFLQTVLSGATPMSWTPRPPGPSASELKTDPRPSGCQPDHGGGSCGLVEVDPHCAVDSRLSHRPTGSSAVVPAESSPARPKASNRPSTFRPASTMRNGCVPPKNAHIGPPPGGAGARAWSAGNPSPACTVPGDRERSHSRRKCQMGCRAGPAGGAAS